MTNVPLLRKVMEHITEHPEEWNQGSWVRHVAIRKELLEDYVDKDEQPLFNEPQTFNGQEYLCKTAFCFAGHAAVMSGASFRQLTPITWDGESVKTPEGKTQHVRTFARDELGITDRDASILFNGGNSIETLQDYVDQLIDHGKITRTAY